MKKSATLKLEEWLLNGKTITALQALNKWGCMRLSARINELRNAGFPILTDNVKQNGKIFARYRLAA
jgi:hypothetical protein